MSEARTARLRASRIFACSRWLQFELADGRPFEFRGGQYLIVDTGLKLPDGRIRKRAYSMLSADADSQRFELGVFRLAGGAGSELLHELSDGAELRFSGPWGKLHVPEDLGTRRGPVWLITTDSGMSAALGLVRGAALAAHLSRLQLWHFRTHADAYLSDLFVREQLGALADLCSEPLASVHAPLRSSELQHWLQGRLHESGELPAQVYLIGDGSLARQASAQLLAAGLTESQIQSESFFNHEKKAKATCRPASM